MYNNYYLHKVILVTGGGSGMGRALCEKLAKVGATVICTDINTQNADETVSLITQSGKNAVARKLDVAQLSDFEAVIADVVKEHGRMDMIFNNAGIAITGELRDISIDQWKKVLDINFYGVLYGSQTAYQYMIKQGSGHIVNTSSLAGVVGYIPLITPYSVSKHAVVNYTRCLRQEAKLFNIKASIVCPGLIDTPIIGSLPAVNADPSWNRDSIKQFEPGMPAEEAAHHILKGVAQNKEIILFPQMARTIFLFARYLKPGYLKMALKELKRFRENYRFNGHN
ncbi:SDR family NAD(P)-dependent oxidoreductase [Mucilaginibacter sp. RCC_168]|uniref:SDR family NAD(P)-dependent oxidoreductase n=1 Tax=Mucilaginibacter sp. RCC_168 TaxID=3239221 RepID=UPI003524747A